MAEALRHRHVRRLEWREPLTVAAALNRRDGALALISDGGATGRWSYVAAEPDLSFEGAVDDRAAFARLRQPAFERNVVGLMSYDAGARPATGRRPDVWPDLMLARYPALLVFDHHRREVMVTGLGLSEIEAAEQADRAVGWWRDAVEAATPSAPGRRFEEEAPADDYEAAVADVIWRIGEGELFQANIARGWSGQLDEWRDPFDVFARLATERGSSFGAFWRMGDRVLVSNSPEMFLTFDQPTGRVETRPIKGTRPRDPDAARDAELAQGLRDSAKDRAENLMIVDLMRNDLARLSRPGSVVVERLFEIESHPTVHHLVSTVVSRARPDVRAADVLEATFPPGSITGAPKHQAMKVIARHEPPRGAWCGSLFVLEGGEGQERLSASVLIRTATFERDGEAWRFRALAGAGIVADSDPQAERRETEDKIRALREAIVGA